jgi:hypothetical protein
VSCYNVLMVSNIDGVEERRCDEGEKRELKVVAGCKAIVKLL